MGSSQKRSHVRRKKIKCEESREMFFFPPAICGSAGSKGRLTIAAGAEVMVPR